MRVRAMEECGVRYIIAVYILYSVGEWFVNGWTGSCSNDKPSMSAYSKVEPTTPMVAIASTQKETAALSTSLI